MPIVTPQYVLAVIALVFGVLSIVPWTHSGYLVSISVVLLSIALIVG